MGGRTNIKGWDKRRNIKL